MPSVFGSPPLCGRDRDLGRSPDGQLWSPPDPNLATLQTRVQREACGHGLGLLAAFFLLCTGLPVGAAVQWLLQSLAVTAFVHHRIRVQLVHNHPPGGQSVHPDLGAANRLTLIRGVLISSLAGLLFIPLTVLSSGPAWLAWAPGTIYLLAAGLDAADGLVARSTGRVTTLGRRLDMEMDGLGLLAASALAVWLGRVPILYLSAGLAFYLFRFGLWYRRRRGKPVHPLPSRPFARTMAGLQMGFVGVALLPVFSVTILHLACFYFMFPLLLGFMVDWLSVSGRVAWARRMTGLSRPFLPMLQLTARVSLLGLAVPVSGELAQSGPMGVQALWWAALAMAVTGCCGRTASLGACLMLAAVSADAGLSPGLFISFSSSLVILILGTGRYSLWAPEERLLTTAAAP